MSKLRFRVVETAFKKKPVPVEIPKERPSEYFGKYVFNKEKCSVIYPVKYMPNWWTSSTMVRHWTVALLTKWPQE